MKVYKLWLEKDDEISRFKRLAFEEVEVMYDHLKKSLSTLGLKEWNDGDNYMKSLRRVFSKTKLERRDVSTIHKLCGEIDKYTIRVREEFLKEQREKEKSSE